MSKKTRIKILSIGQVPIEVGGNYTTGIARVVYELSKQKYDKVEVFFYGTNIKDCRAKELSNYMNQYMGYVFSPFDYLFKCIIHPVDTFRRWYHYKRKSYNNPLHYDFIWYNFRRAIEKIRPDLIHLHGFGLDALYFANKDYNIPILHTHHGVMWDGDENDKITKHRYLNNIHFADYYTGLNDEVRRKMLNLGIPNEKITIIPNGVDCKKYYYSYTDRLKLRSDLNIPNKRLVFVTVGVVIERKGQLKTLKLLMQLGIDFEYWIIGKGPDEETITNFVKSNSLQSKVKLLGYKNDTDLYRYLSAADIYMHASDMEGQALSETEAYATGLRVVVNSRIARTVVGDVSDANIYHVIDYENPDIKSLIEWINQSVCRESRSKYDWSTIASLYQELYLTLLQR